MEHRDWCCSTYVESSEIIVWVWITKKKEDCAQNL